MTSESAAETKAVAAGLRTLGFLITPLLISLFFLEALRLYYAELYLVVWAALFSEPIDLSGLLGAVLMLSCFLAPLLVPLLRRVTSAPRIALSSLIGAAVASVFVSAGLPFQVEVVASYVTIACYCLFLPSYCEDYCAANSHIPGARYLVAGFVLALAYDMAIRALGTTVDLSLRPEWLPLQAILSAVIIAAALLCYREGVPTSQKNDPQTASSWMGALILSGFGGLLFLEYNLFIHANTVARWVQVDYDLLAILVPAATVVGLLIPDVKPARRYSAIIQNLLILASVAAFLWVDGWGSAILILVGQACVILDLRILFSFVTSRSFKWKTSTVVAVGLTLSLFLAFILVLIYTFSFAYAYTLDLFRGTEPLPFFVAAVTLGLTSMLAAWKMGKPETVMFDGRWAKVSLALLPVVLAAAAFVLQPSISPQPTGNGSITVMTYNIHQAFGVDDKLDLQEIVDTIKRGDPDIIGLQETDAGRVPSLSVDQVLWLSRKLNMYSAYGPSWGNTYGVAVLSKYPIVEQQRYLLTSEEQQRACLQTRVDIGGQDLHFFAVHLGLNSEERKRQLDEVLTYTAQVPAPEVLVGDFNAHPDSHEIQRVLDQFQDAFALGGTGSGYTSPAEGPRETIDYIFVSPDIQVASAQVIPSLASDHLPVVAEIEVQSR